MLGPLKLCNLCARLNHFLGVYGKSLGVQNDRLGQHSKMDVRGKMFFFRFFPPFHPVLFAFFHLFSKKSKQAILFHDFLHEKCVDQKNGVHHDEQHGKSQKIATSVFSFPKLCHRYFCKTFSEIFNFLTPLHSQNAEEMDFCTLGPLKLCNLWA